MSIVTIHLADERALSWNALYSGMHWSARRNIAQTKSLLAKAAAQNLDIEMFTVPVDVYVVATYRGQVADADNVYDKSYIDGLKGVLIPDDDARYIRRVITEPRKGNADSVTITLIPVEEE